MPNVSVYGRGAARISNRSIAAGSTEVPVSVAVTGNVYELEETIANAANAVIYNSSLTDFAYVFLASDFDVRLLMTDDAAASISVTLKGTGVSGKLGVPFQLGSSATTSGQKLITFQAFNTSGSSAKVKILAIE